MRTRAQLFRRWIALTMAVLPVPPLADVARAQSNPKVEIVPQIPHSRAVLSVAFSPDGTRVISGSADNTAKLWHTATGQYLRTFAGHVVEIQSMAFSPDGTRVLSGSRDRTVKLWDATTGKLLRTFVGHSDAVRSVAFSPDGTNVLSGSEDQTLKLWNTASGKLLRTFEKGSGKIWSVAFSPDGGRVLSGGGDKTLKLWDVASGRLLRTFVGHSDWVSSVAFSPDGSRVLSGSFDKTLKLWDVTTGEFIRTLEGHSGGVNSVAFSPDGTRVLSGSRDRAVNLWDATTGQLLRTFEGDSGEVWSVAFSPDGTGVLSGNEGQTLKLWDAATGQLLRTFEGDLGEIWSVAFSPDGSRVLSGSFDKTLKLWDVTTGELIRTFEGHSGEVNSVAFSPDGTRILSGGWDNTLKLWNVKTGTLIRTFEGHSGGVTSLVFSPDGTRVLSGSVDRTLKLWETATGQLLRTLQGHSGGVNSVAFSPNSILVLSGSQDRTVKLWDAATGKLLRTFMGHADAVRSVAFSPDGSRVLSGSGEKSVRSTDRTMRLWEVATGKLLRTFRGHSDWILSVAFSPDGVRVLSGSGTGDNTAKLWDTNTGQLLHTFEQPGPAVSVAFPPDGRRIVTASADTSIRLWDPGTGELRATLITTRDGEWLAITPEGYFFASPGGNKVLAIVRGLEVFSIEQFYQILYRPDLVREKLAGDPNGKVREAASKLDLAKLLDSGPVPRVAFTSHKAVESSTNDLLTVEASVTDQGGGIGRAEWRINGTTVGVFENHNIAGRMTTTLKQSIALDPGENTIELVAYNGRNLVASIPAQTKVFWTGTEPTAPPRLHVLAIGINDYWDGKLKLTYAVPDAKSLASALREAGKQLFEDVLVTEVLDGDATAAHLDQVFADLSHQIRPRDVFVFYAAGHGTTFTDEVTKIPRYYFIPQDFKYQTEESFATSGIGQNRLQAWLAKIPAKKSILIFDTCESGSLTMVQLTSLRGGFEQKGAVGRLIQATGRSTLTAALENQPALEGYRGHGVFTFAMLDALARGDRNNDGLIQITELIEHIDDLVPEITVKTWNTRQIPQSHFQGTNFAIARQLPSLAPAPGEPMIISTTPTHVNVELLQVFKEVGGQGTVITELPPFTTVTLVKHELGWALVAKDGKLLGYVADASLRKLN